MPRWNQYKIGTAREVHALQAAAEYCAAEGLPFASELASLHAKIVTPKAWGGMQIGDAVRVQEALVEASAGKVVAVEGDFRAAFWVIVRQRLGSYKATIEEARTIGGWLSRQHWLSGSMTIDQIARGWPSYLARAEAEAKQGVAGDDKAPEFEGEQ